MIRLFAIGLASLSLAACATHYAPVKPGEPVPPDLPDAALVQPCDTAETDPANNGQLANELSRTRRQRDDCATRMGGVATWRADAAKRAVPVK